MPDNSRLKEHRLPRFFSTILIALKLILKLRILLYMSHQMKISKYLVDYSVGIYSKHVVLSLRGVWYVIRTYLTRNILEYNMMLQRKFETNYKVMHYWVHEFAWLLQYFHSENAMSITKNRILLIWLKTT